MRNQIEAEVQPAGVCFIALKGHCDPSTVNHGSKINHDHKIDECGFVSPNFVPILY